MKIRFSKRATIALTTALVVAGAGAAYAYVTGGSASSLNPSTGSVLQAGLFTVDDIPQTAFPLDQSVSIPVVVRNATPQKLRLNNVRVDAINWVEADCGLSTNFVSNLQAVGEDVPAATIVGGVTTPGSKTVLVSVTLLNDPNVPQDKCKPVLVARANPTS